MSSEWEKMTIDGLTTLVTKGTTPTSIGGRFSESGIPFVKVESISESGRLIPDKFAFIDASTDELLGRSRIRQDDVLFSIAGTIGRVALVNREHGQMNTNQAVALVRPDTSLIEPRFLYYSLRDTTRIQVAQSKVVQSVQANFSLGELKQLQIDLPPKAEQKVIAHILGTLDDKIELNRKTNETLEAMAKALFKSWFVDFDPVRAKAEGRPTGLPAEISDLFPDSFEDSELGEIPSGWSVRRLRDFIKPVKDRQGDRNIEEYSATVTGIEPRDSRFKKNLSRSGDKNKVALEGDLVFGLSRRTINFGRMAQPIGAFSSVYEVFRSTSGSTISTKIVEQCIRLRMSEFMIILKPAAREGQAIDREVLLEQLIADFPEQVNTLLEILLEPVSKRIELTSEHIFALEQLRDALLPKLISGEIRIPDAEKMLEEVGI